MLLPKIISWIFHPLLMPSYGILILFHYDVFIPSDARLQVFGIVFIFSFLLPVLNILFLRWRNVISSIQVGEREQRHMPYLSTAIVYAASFFMLRKAIPAPSVECILLGSAAGVLVTFISNYFFKISAHMVGIGGLTGGVLFLSIAMGWNTSYEMILLFLLAGLIAGARLSLDAHTPLEVICGYFFGLFSQVFILFMM